MTTCAMSRMLTVALAAGFLAATITHRGLTGWIAGGVVVALWLAVTWQAGRSTGSCRAGSACQAPAVDGHRRPLIHRGVNPRHLPEEPHLP